MSCSPLDIARWCATHFDIDATASALTGEVDLNFRLQASTGENFLAKLSHVDEREDIIDFQNNAMMRIAGHHPDLPVPRLRAMRNGQFVTTIVDQNGKDRFLRVMTWCDGKAMAHVPKSKALREQTGRIAAQLLKALHGFSHPGQERSLIWNMMQAQELKSKFETLSPELQVLVGPWYDSIVNDFLPQRHGLPTQVIHNDLNLHNLLVNDNGTISGVLDFGDMVSAPRCVELAVAAAYQADSEGDVLASIVDMAANFHAHETLSAAEQDWLVPLVAMRACMTIIVTHWTSQLYPDNKTYLLRNEPSARKLLQSLSQYSEATRRACIRDGLETVV
jgi:hydroxylysine kinase